ncbi:RNA-directed DNA polymerase [Clostridium gasigenes]|uniref:RNA-directed DNA polymerase n=1 Tax=Clostridium gasigenes TaxID=94869 RepID=A0A7X0SDH6_9CLOT|nr:RNA-directed DNA polymerase [Clostridium gasigenes]MBB6715572.1 RNA-directed DNA polymerase [Clostridium gasigenes]
MKKYDIEKISREVMYNGLFSEYLPENFNLDIDRIDIFQVQIAKKNDFIEPYKYTMSRFSENDKRRTISLPDITSYIDLMNYINEMGFIKEFLDISIESKQSFSKLLQNNGELYKHEEQYDQTKLKCENNTGDRVEAKSTFIPNIIKKMNIAKGAKGVLYLDISNFFGNIYTHILPVIVLGYDETMKQFKLSSQNNSKLINDNRYKRYVELDKRIRMLNGNRTNGILVGPLISKMIGEALLVEIDSEISKEGIKFTRFVDDYEVYIYDEGCIEQVTNTITNILNKYYLNLNNEKSKYVKFPYYKVENLEKIIDSYGNIEADPYELMEVFNKFFELETNGIKGAIRYLIKSIEKKEHKANEEIFSTYLLNVLVNDTRSLTKVCQLLIKEKDNIELDGNFVEIIENLLLSNIDSKKDLEVIWLLYLMKSIGIIDLKKDIAKKVIDSRNELAIIILIYEFDKLIYIEYENDYIKSAKSWILVYQLFLRGDIKKEDFISRMGLKNNYNFYNHLKREKFSFYKSIKNKQKTTPFI